MFHQDIFQAVESSNNAQHKYQMLLLQFFRTGRFLISAADYEKCGDLSIPDIIRICIQDEETLIQMIAAGICDFGVITGPYSNLNVLITSKPSVRQHILNHQRGSRSFLQYFGDATAFFFQDKLRSTINAYPDLSGIATQSITELYEKNRPLAFNRPNLKLRLETPKRKFEILTWEGNAVMSYHGEFYQLPEMDDLTGINIDGLLLDNLPVLMIDKLFRLGVRTATF